VLARGHRGGSPRALVFGAGQAVSASVAATAALGYDEVRVRSPVPDPRLAPDSRGRLARVKERLASG
jgi:hypothetical protein